MLAAAPAFWLLAGLAATTANAIDVDLSAFGVTAQPKPPPVTAVPVMTEDDGADLIFARSRGRGRGRRREEPDPQAVPDDWVAPIACKGGMQVDTDGPPDDNPIPDPDTHQDETSATYDDGHDTYLSAFRIPYVVKPLGARAGRGNCSSYLTPVKLWDFVRVTYKGVTVTAIVADEGPPGKFGEASVAVHDLLGNVRARENVGIGEGVTYVFYPNSGIRATSEKELLKNLREWTPPVVTVPEPRPPAQPSRPHRRRRRDG